MWQLFELYCQWTVTANQTNIWERLARSLSALFCLGREEGKRPHWKRGVRWHRAVCQLCHGAERGTPWWLAEGRIAEPLYDQRVPHTAELHSLDLTLLVRPEDWLMNRGSHYHHNTISMEENYSFHYMHAGMQLMIIFIITYSVDHFQIIH